MSGQEERDDAARLEAALDRISRAAARPAKAALPGAPAGATHTDPLLPELAARLDGLIVQLRATLGTEA
jgi:hypothetical protein